MTVSDCGLTAGKRPGILIKLWRPGY